MSCLEVGVNANVVIDSSYLDVGVFCDVTYSLLEVGVDADVVPIALEIEVGLPSNVDLWKEYISNVFVNPTVLSLDTALLTIAAQEEIDGNPSGGQDGGSTQYDNNLGQGVNPWELVFMTNTEGGELVQIAPRVIPSLKLHANEKDFDLSDYILEMDITRPLGGKSSFSVTMKQVLGEEDTFTAVPDEIKHLFTKLPSDLNVLFLGTNTFENSIISHKFDNSRYLVVELTLKKPGGGDQKWKSCYFAPGTPSFDGYTLSWGGEDFSVLFEQENQSLTDIMPDDTTKHTAHEVIKDICNSKGVTSVNMTFPDYTIRQLRRQGDQPINWMDQLALIYQAQRFWEGETLHYTTPVNPGTSNTTPKFKLIDTVNIRKDEVHINQLDDFKNKFTISRLKSVGGVYAEQRCGPGTECPGRTVKLTFDEPLSSVILHIDLYGDCHLQDFVFFDEADRPVAGNEGGGPPMYTGAAKVVRVEATCVPHFNGFNSTIGTGGGGSVFVNAPYQVNMVGYRVFARGSAENVTNFSEDYNFSVSDTETIALFGERPEYQNIESEVIPTAAVAQDAVKAILAENIRKVFRANVQLPDGLINPFINPGDVISMTDYLTGQENVNWLVENTKLSWSEGIWKQELELTRGLNE